MGAIFYMFLIPVRTHVLVLSIEFFDEVLNKVWIDSPSTGPAVGGGDGIPWSP